VNIHSFVINTCELSQKHTAVNLRAHLMETLQEWEILPSNPAAIDRGEDTNDDDDNGSIASDNSVEVEGKLIMIITAHF